MNYRRHLITGEPILYAPERAGRPNAFGGQTAPQRCPFCPGHESDTPPEISRLGGDRWSVRVIPNKYPASPYHEVIVESPHHDDTFAGLADPAAVVDVYRQRYTDVISREGVRHVCIFKNHGPGAGASIPHIHSQLIGTPFQPPRVAREAESFARAGECPLCQALATHRREGLIIEENEHVVRLAPYGSTMAYQQWVIPKRHQPELTTFNDGEVAALADTLSRAGAATLRLASSMNWIFMSFAREEAAHFYVDIFPRLTTPAGYELGTGTWIGIVDPRDAARKVSS